jgi:hypothetical protein
MGGEIVERFPLPRLGRRPSNWGRGILVPWSIATMLFEPRKQSELRGAAVADRFVPAREQSGVSPDHVVSRDTT